MSILPAFSRPATRPALAPILFPFSTDELLWNRATSIALHDNLASNPRNCRASREELITRQLSWIFRLDRRIAQVVS